MEKPIIFSTEMVKAILDGRKTQTRRVVKPQPILKDGLWTYTKNENTVPAVVNDKTMGRFCPYGQAGDKLWVRETFCEHTTGGVIYKASETPYEIGKDGGGIYSYHRWQPSIHMPRWASRITLEITEVRVERLQEIEYEDAFAEGFHDGENVRMFVDYWDSLNTKRGYGWKANPWVWVISFRRSDVTTKQLD